MSKTKPVGWETDAEWELETRVFHQVNNHDLPEETRRLLADLWAQYCLAADPHGGVGTRDLVKMISPGSPFPAESLTPTKSANPNPRRQ